MKIYGERLRVLRENSECSQDEFGKLFGVGQSSINRYENGKASPPLELLMKIADHFDVSLDYILGRTEYPQGRLYEVKPRIDYTPEMERFIEACFDSDSPMNARLRQALIQMLKEGKE